MIYGFRVGFVRRAVRGPDWLRFLWGEDRDAPEVSMPVGGPFRPIIPSTTQGIGFDWDGDSGGDHDMSRNTIESRWISARSVRTANGDLSEV
jgi:hypothetical protein